MDSNLLEILKIYLLLSALSDIEHKKHKLCILNLAKFLLMMRF
jgi:hypothetical protein